MLALNTEVRIHMTGEKKTAKKKVTKTGSGTKKASAGTAAKKTSSTKKTSPKKSVTKTAAKPATKKSTTKTAGAKKTTTKVATKKSPVKKTATKKNVTKKTNATKASKPSAASKAEKSSVIKKAAPKKANQLTASTKENTAVEQTQLEKHQDSTPIPTPETPPSSQALVRGKFTPYSPQPDEEYMNAQQLNHFKLILNDWKSELMEEVDRTVDHMKDDSANLPDPADRATQEEEFNLELRTRDRERKLIKKIDKTLERIEHDDYGFCDGCGIEIGLRRLEARPTADLCIDCKTLDEIKERQFRS